LNSGKKEEYAMRVRDLAGPGPSPTVQIEAAPAYELLLTLYTFYNPEEVDSYAVGPAWFEETRAKVAMALNGDLAAAAVGLGHMWPQLVGLAREVAPPRGVPAFLDYLEAAPPRELLLHALGYYHSGGYHHASPEVIERAANGDPRAQEEYLGPMDEHDGKRPALDFLFSLPPDETQRLIVAILRRWYEEVFRAEEPRLLPILERDAAAKRRLIPRMSPEQLIERVTNGVRYTREAGIDRVVLIPSFILRPWVLITAHANAKIVFYSVSDESLMPAREPSAARLSQLYKALADEKRLQILKRIAASSCTLQQIADDLGLGKSLVHHHLFTLRSAGLIGVSTESDKRYSLRADAIAGAGDFLAAYLKEGSGATPPRTRRPARPRQPRPIAPAANRRGPDDEP
jgi:DNA-binding transcriptional ArsR family regulator